MRKRISFCFLLLLMTLMCASCGNRQILLFLNWGEYVDENVLEAFEEKYQCEVMMDLGESNEIFYSKVRGGTTVYDVVCPSDYMVEKMYANHLLSKIDFSKMPNYQSRSRMPGVVGIANTMEENQTGITDYYVPYLWGTWGIMYSKLVEGLKEAILSNENEWACLFDRSSIPSGTKVAMYDSHLHAYYAACQYLNLSHTEELSSSDLKKIYDLVRQMNFNAWGTDNIKKDIVAGNIDVGFMWTGDFLYYYCENVASTVMDAYLAGDVSVEDISSMIHTLIQNEGVYTKNQRNYEVGFDIYIPKNTVAFCDNLVITKDSRHYDLALKFIDFMCSRSMNEDEIDPAYSNTYYVSYNSPWIDVYDDILSLRDTEFSKEDEEIYLSEKKEGTDSYDSSLFWKSYDMAIGLSFEKYYPKEEQGEGNKKYKGDILANFDRQYVNTINNTFNNARA